MWRTLGYINNEALRLMFNVRGVQEKPGQIHYPNMPPKKSKALTVWDFAHRLLPHPPPYLKPHQSDFLTQTKDTSKTELNLSHEARLEHVVFAPEMFKDLTSGVQNELEATPIRSPEHDKLQTIMGLNYRTEVLPHKISSEKDVELWIFYVVLMTVWDILRLIVKLPTGVQEYWFSSSTGDGGTRPDFSLMRDPNNKFVLTVEVKASKVIATRDGTIFSNYQVLPAKLNDSGIPAMKFNWPTKKNDEKSTKIFVQVITPVLHQDTKSSDSRATEPATKIWNQMHIKDVLYAMLSTYEHTIFFYRDPALSKTLFFSSTYESNEPILIPAISEFMMAALYNTKLNHSKIDFEWYLDLPEFQKQNKEGFTGIAAS